MYHGLEECYLNVKETLSIRFASSLCSPPHVAVGGTLAIHDVFSDPALGGQAPYEEIYLAAINSKNFEETSCTGSLRILQRVK